MDSLLSLVPGSVDPVAPSLLAARTVLSTAAERFLAIPDERLASDWHWSGGGVESEVRYAYYRALERLESSARDAHRAIAEAGVVRQPAGGIFATATQARWDLHGIIAALADADLDRDPGDGEWTLRETLAHTVNGQRAYGSFTAWWLSRANEPDFPASVPDGVGADFADEESDGVGSLADIRQRLDDLIDLHAGLFARLDDGQLAVAARWSGSAQTVGFRFARMSSHLQEHTVQVEKTLAMLGHVPSEAERLVRLIHRAYGRLESALYGLPADRVEAVAGDIVKGAAGEVGGLAASLAG